MTKRVEKVYVLRTCKEDLTAYNAFLWPESGKVSCPDWDPTPECGNGLHGLLWGAGDASLLDWSDTAKWLVVEVDASKIVELDDKVKFPSGKVVYCGHKDGAIACLVSKGADQSKMICGVVVNQDRKGQATASGYQGQATASGYQGQATASGDSGQATASGWKGQATASGDWGQATASGDYGQATASGKGGHATASGKGGQATASGDWGQATASGYQSQATASGYQSQATASGDSGQATASGWKGQARAGEGGSLTLAWWDNNGRKRLVTFYVGEDGILPNTWYRCENGKAVEVAEKE